MLEEFLKSFLEPVSYLIYAILVFKYSKVDKAGRIKNLLFYYIFASGFLFFGQFVIDNNWVYNLFFFLTASFFSYFYYSIFTIRNSRKMVLVFCALNLILFLGNDVVFRQLLEENNYARSFYFFTIIIYSLIYLYETIREVNESNILEQFNFWLTAGNLFYFLGSLCIVLYYKYPSTEQRGALWIMQSIILFCSSLITYAGTSWLMKQKKFH